MNRVRAMAMALICCGAWTGLYAGAVSPGQQQGPPATSQKGNATPAAPPAASQPESNPFPTDTTNIPVMPSADSPGSIPSSNSSGNVANIAMPSDDADPVRSPDDPGSESTGEVSGSSDSSSGLDQLLQPPPDTGHNRKGGDDSSADMAFPHDGPKKNLNIGEFYLESGDWRGALSRFESAMVEDPENPDVYWGLAEAERHLGQFAQAKAYYLKVVDYDPDSKHGKDARKILRQPEIANAPEVAAPAKPARPSRP
jgi:hypothetical protein